MINFEGIGNVIPDKKYVKDAVGVYYTFYTQEQEITYGVVAITIEKI